MESPAELGTQAQSEAARNLQLMPRTGQKTSPSPRDQLTPVTTVSSPWMLVEAHSLCLYMWGAGTATAVSCHHRGGLLFPDPRSLPFVNLAGCCWHFTYMGRDFLGGGEFFKRRKKGLDSEWSKKNSKHPLHLTKVERPACVYWPLRCPSQWITHTQPLLLLGGSSFSHGRGWVLYKFQIITLKPIICVKVHSSSLWLIFSLVMMSFIIQTCHAGT